MKEEKGKLQRKTESEESLEEYIRVASPGTLVVVVSLLVVFLAFLIWGFIGELPVTKKVNGFVEDYNVINVMMDEKYSEDDYEVGQGDIAADMHIVCLIDSDEYELSEVKDFDDEVVIKMHDKRKIKGRITGVNSLPVNKEDSSIFFLENEWAIQKCFKGDYDWIIEITCDENIEDDCFTMAEVTFTTEKVSPISFLFN